MVASASTHYLLSRNKLVNREFHSKTNNIFSSSGRRCDTHFSDACRARRQPTNKEQTAHSSFVYEFGVVTQERKHKRKENVSVECLAVITCIQIDCCELYSGIGRFPIKSNRTMNNVTASLHSVQWIHVQCEFDLLSHPWIRTTQMAKVIYSVRKPCAARGRWSADDKLPNMHVADFFMAGTI